MPAIHDAAVGDAGADGTVPLTINYTTTTGATLLLVMVGVDTTTDRNPVASSDLDGALTLVGEVLASADNQGCALFKKENPSIGAHVITCDTDNVSSADLIEGIVVSFDDTNATTLITDAGTDSGSAANISTTVANAASGDLIVDFFVVNGNPTITVGADQTERINLNNGGSAGTMYGMSTQAGASGGVMSWTWTGNRRTAQVAARLPAAGGGGGGPRRKGSLALVGVGR